MQGDWQWFESLGTTWAKGESDTRWGWKQEAKSSSELTKDIDIILGQQEDCSEA